MSILPGSTLGILGSGQLGRMLTMTAKRLGYKVHIFSPERNSPAGQVADLEVTAEYSDEDAIRQFASQVDVITIEFENIPATTLEILAQQVPVYPQPHVLELTQHRLREKNFLSSLGLPLASFYPVQNEAELVAGCQSLTFPLVLKTAGFGYDGKGQVKLNQTSEALPAFERLERQPCVLEAFIDLRQEISVIAARNDAGEFRGYLPVENRHRNHILDITLAPADLDEQLQQQALVMTKTIMDALHIRGLLCVEFFVTNQGELLINELAPRAHNSGHLTLEAAACSQFEQQLRAVCGLPLGSTEWLRPAAMVNLLGNLWREAPELEFQEPDWSACFNFPKTYLHLYGKTEAKPGRKMGHITALGETAQQAETTALQARKALCRQGTYSG